ncbi:MAG: class 3 adenylate cyclase/predicted metal-dependent HD superfamily phosphohydrolase [Saprospiraceae bacterium]|jgi:class 3 adenylate cyclase/predicted metal-dependent HD superfamily phosphohydrolase
MIEFPFILLVESKDPFWFSWWFVAVVIFLISGPIFYFSRMSFFARQQKILEEKIKIRTGEIEKQKAELVEQKRLLEEELHRDEQLLLNMLPRNVAKEIIETGKAAPKNYQSASVMFVDFKNFTKISENLRPTELVAELDDSFAHFDDIVDEYGVEKIKTSGDAYMCVGGIPERNRTHAVDTVLAGMGFLKIIEKKKKKREGTGKPQWELRVGIHTGQLVAGVIGKKKFLYDVWGDTVNIASRMEGSGEAGKINISEATFNQVKQYFDCEYRGKFPVKNKGKIDMYYVKRIKRLYSEDEQGLIANRKLRDHLNFNVYGEIGYRKVRRYMIDRLKNNLPEGLHYHGLHHTIDVINAAERIAQGEEVDKAEKMLIKVAALFHDSGFLNKYQGNEPEGVKLANEILPKYGFTNKQIKRIEGMIMATIIPQRPTNILEEIMCDADLDYLGRSKEEFYNISNSLKQELLEHGLLKDEEDWDPIQVNFLTEHRFFTQTAVVYRRANKVDRLNEIKEKLKDKKKRGLNKKES